MTHVLAPIDDVQRSSAERIAKPREATRVIIVGAGGHGKEVASYIRELEMQGRVVSLEGFVDDHKPPGRFAGSDIIGGLHRLASVVQQHADRTFRYITAAGDGRVRQRLVSEIDRVAATALRPWTLVHGRALVGPDVEIGEGSCLAPGSIATTDVRIGRHVIVNVNASLSHEGVIGDFATIGPGAVLCGNVTIGVGCYIGAGATIIEGVSVGEWSVIGAGAVVTDDVPSCATAVGVPARVIKRTSPPDPKHPQTAVR